MGPDLVHDPHLCDRHHDRNRRPAVVGGVSDRAQYQRPDDGKIDRIMRKCRIDDSSFLRAALTIRKSGGNPESEAMQPKILAYAACV